MTISVERAVYRGWEHCYRLTNGVVTLIATADVGLRIVHFSLVDQPNEFKTYDDDVGPTGSDTWQLYGGHRLWYAPEDRLYTEYPDNEPVDLEQQGDLVRLIQPVERVSGIQKEIDIQLAPGQAQVTMTHRLRQTGSAVMEIAPWALSVMDTGGVAIIPLPPRLLHGETLLPANTLTLWPYTDMSDPRWVWGQRYILARHDPTQATAQKVGAMCPNGWTAYARNGHLFVKTFDYQEGATYPDFGCSVEVFMVDSMLELETLAPLAQLQPGGMLEYTEQWFLLADVPQPGSEAEVADQVLPRIKETCLSK